MGSRRSGMTQFSNYTTTHPNLNEPNMIFVYVKNKGIDQSAAR